MTAAEDILARAPGRIRRHLSEFLRLATPVIATRTGLLLQAVGLVPAMLFTTTTFFLEGLGRPYPALAAITLGNIANIGLNILVIYGLAGLPASGAEGAALATAVARWVMAIGLIAYVWWLKDHHRLGICERLPKGWWRESRQQRRYGYAAGLSYGFETASFGIMAVYAGWLGTDAAAVYGVCMSMMSMIFMAALGFATATSVRVGIAHGRRDWTDRALAGWTGLAVTLGIMAVAALALWTLPEWVLGIYLSDEALIALALPSVALIGFIMFGDGGQIVMAQALRGAADTWIPTAMNFFSYMAVMIPCGYLFTQVWPHGVFGLFEAIAVGSAVSVSVLTGRWIRVCVRPNP